MIDQVGIEKNLLGIVSVVIVVGRCSSSNSGRLVWRRLNGGRQSGQILLLLLLVKDVVVECCGKWRNGCQLQRIKKIVSKGERREMDGEEKTVFLSQFSQFAINTSERGTLNYLLPWEWEKRSLSIYESFTIVLHIYTLSLSLSYCLSRVGLLFVCVNLKRATV